MLNIQRSSLIETFTRPVASTVTYIEEGTALVSQFESGNEVVRPATGVANENFVGFALSEAVSPDFINVSETFTIPATGPATITLSRSFDTSKAFSFTVVSGAGVRTVVSTIAGTASATAVAVSGQVITFQAPFAGFTVYALYKSAITVAESGFLYPRPSGRSSYTEITDIGVISKGPIHITNFDPTVDWAAFNAVTNPVKLAANGLVTLGGTGTSTTNSVAGLPEANDGFLVLRVNA